MGRCEPFGEKIGKSEEYVSHRMQILKMPDGVKERIMSSDLSVSQALELAGLDARNQDGVLRFMDVANLEPAKQKMSSFGVLGDRCAVVGSVYTDTKARRA